MRKNVGSQVICAQLNSKTDGSAVTSGTTTVYVLGDGGTQASGGGTVAHEGQGCWSYVPTQAETNYNHVAFTFVNSTAISQTVQVYPVSYDPTDAAGLGLSRLDAAITSRASQASLDTVDDFLDTEVAAIKAKTDNLPSDPADASDIAGAFTTVNSKLDAIDDFLDTEVAAIKAKTDNLPASPAAVGSAMTLAADSVNASALAADAVAEIQSGLSTLNAAGVRTAIGLASANLDTQLDALPTAAENADAVWDEARSGHSASGTFGEGVASVQGNVTGSVASVTAVSDKTGYALTSGERTSIAEALLKLDLSTVTGEAARSVLNALRFLRNKWAISGTTLTVTKEDDATTAWTASVTTNASADPVTGSDPA